ncbi:MAG: bifunctional UDP-N-acetylglucosamine diphosphorylase/glucosamine-1-phosphate N-acetyltransferase GlmU [Fimbriimonadaceae bacterium]|nr:bifunctional UDP-N-acetylglucosamine diphosphorylase/glucosamine-1-phosphate N-acetyltransferase GlmU [Fimbriimonadaceae bacterium]
MTSPFIGVILAAGQGLRMKSSLPKVLHPVCGLPMVEWVVRAMHEAGAKRIIVVVGNGADKVRTALADYDLEFVEQSERLGTGHAVMMAAPLIQDWEGQVVVSAGDTPLLEGRTIYDLVERLTEEGSAAALTTGILDDPSGYGRIVRNKVTGEFEEIVEHKNCTPEQLLIKEWNPALYSFNSKLLLEALPQLSRDNKQGEYLLTDVLGILRKSGYWIAVETTRNNDQFLGVNDRWQLAEASSLKRIQILRDWCEIGATILDPGTTFIGADVTLEPDCVILPNTVIDGKTSIGTGSAIGPNSWIKDSVIGQNCRIFMSHLDQAVMEDDCRCGPFSNLRPGAHLLPEAKIGNFVEIKNSTLGSEVSVSHLTYIGDSQVGARTNIGAGTITCNYDGFSKHRTLIGADSFIGSNSTLVAPLKIGDEVMIAAGSVVTKDVESGDLAVGRGRQENKPEWYRRWKNQKVTADR